MPPLHHVSSTSTSPITSAMGHENLSLLIVVQPPLVATAFRKDFKDAAHWMVPPHSSSKFCSALLRGPRLANPRVIEYALVPVKPPIRSPHKTVHAFMGVLVTKTIQQ